ncbi:MAG: YlxR family protein [Chloroflexi bacterium]|nr:YlxR family protein [Chloroflexota bacterium]
MGLAQPRHTTNRVRHEAERSCVGCRQSRLKRELIRLVKTASGTVAVDHSGKLHGRGAYLCQDAACWKKGLGGSALEHHLRLERALEPGEREALLNEGIAIATSRGMAEHRA